MYNKKTYNSYINPRKFSYNRTAEITGFTREEAFNKPLGECNPSLRGILKQPLATMKL